MGRGQEGKVTQEERRRREEERGDKMSGGGETVRRVIDSRSIWPGTNSNHDSTNIRGSALTLAVTSCRGEMKCSPLICWTAELHISFCIRALNTENYFTLVGEGCCHTDKKRNVSAMEVHKKDI